MTPVKFLASEIAHAVGGALVGPEVEVRGAAIDSRLVRPGQLFIPVAGERDGPGVIAAARTALRRRPEAAAGAAAASMAFLLHASIDWDWQLPAVALPAVTLAGLLIAISERAR